MFTKYTLPLCPSMYKSVSFYLGGMYGILIFIYVYMFILFCFSKKKFMW